MTLEFDNLLREIKSCNFCALHLKLPPKPVVQIDPEAKILIIAQAPGIKARTSGRPFDDASGDRLRSWLGIDRDFFYDAKKIACMPMGFCFPGTVNGADLPPCKECAPIWHPQIIPMLPNIQLKLIVGTYAQKFYLQQNSMRSVMEQWQKYLPDMMPLPHPSWRNSAWLYKNPWFDDVLVPYLQARVREIF